MNKRPFNTVVVVLLSLLFSTQKYIYCSHQVTASETERAPFIHRTDTPLATQASSHYPTNVLWPWPKRSECQERANISSAISIPSLMIPEAAEKLPSRASNHGSSPVDTFVDLNHQLREHRDPNCQTRTITGYYWLGYNLRPLRWQIPSRRRKK